MKKILFIFAFLLPITAQAQLLDLSKVLQPLAMSEVFLRRLSKCVPYEEEKVSQMLSYDINATYRIYGPTERKECEFEFVSTTSLGFSASQICYLPPDIMESYVGAIKRLLGKPIYISNNPADMTEDPDYKIVAGITGNKQYCDFYRDPIDFTKKIRDNLMNCKPTWETQNTGLVDITRKIIGLSGSACHYEVAISFKRSDLNNLSGSLIDLIKQNMGYEEEQTFLYTCYLDEYDLGELRDIYASMVIPAAKTYQDMLYIQPKQIQDAEPAFIRGTCSFEKL